MKKGYAIGCSDIKTDTIAFFYDGNVVDFPITVAVMRLTRFSPVKRHYTAKIADLKKLQARLERGKKNG